MSAYVATRALPTSRQRSLKWGLGNPSSPRQARGRALPLVPRGWHMVCSETWWPCFLRPSYLEESSCASLYPAVLAPQEKTFQLLNPTWGDGKQGSRKCPFAEESPQSATKRMVFNLIVFIYFNELLCIKEHVLKDDIKAINHILSLNLQKWKDYFLMRREGGRPSAR